MHARCLMRCVQWALGATLVAGARRLTINATVAAAHLLGEGALELGLDLVELALPLQMLIARDRSLLSEAEDRRRAHPRDPLRLRRR